MNKSLLILLSVSFVVVTTSLWAQSGSPFPASKQVEESDQSLETEMPLEADQSLDADVSDVAPANSPLGAEVNASKVVNETNSEQGKSQTSGQTLSKGTFKPSEEIVEDQAVSFPVDI